MLVPAATTPTYVDAQPAQRRLGRFLHRLRIRFTGSGPLALAILLSTSVAQAAITLPARGAAPATPGAQWTEQEPLGFRSLGYRAQFSSTTLPILGVLGSAPAPSQPVITAPPFVTANQAGYSASTPAQDGCRYAWTVAGGSLTAGDGTPAITFTAGGGSSVTLTCTVTNSDASASSSGSATMTVVAGPVQPVITMPAYATADQPGYPASVPAQSGITFTWTMTGGMITSGQGTNAITFTAGSVGTLSLSCTATNQAGTASSPGNATTSVVAAPMATITAAGSVTTGMTGLTASVAVQSGCTFKWTIQGGTITSGTTGQTVTYTAGAVGTLTLSCTVTNAAGTQDAEILQENVQVLDISGTFTGGDLGTVIFFQSGTSIYSPNSNIGRLQGTLSDLVLKGTDANGRAFSLTFSQNGDSYSGSYNNNSYETGTGTRQVGVVSVDANPKLYVLKVGSSQAFQAVSAGSLDKGVQWTCTAGSIDSSGSYVAPSTPCLAMVKATATADPTKSCNIPFQVTGDGILDISGTFSGGDLGTVTFYQSGTTIYGLNSSIGKLQGTLSGLHLQGNDANGRTFSLTFSQDGNSYSGSYYNNSYGTGTGTRQVGVVSVDANPKPYVFKVGSSQTFQAVSAGSLDKGFQWTCTAGSIDSSGSYMAPSTPCLAMVKATATADPTKSCNIPFQVTGDGILDISGTFSGGDLGTVTFYQSGTTIYGLNSSIGKLQGTLSGLNLQGNDANGRTFSLAFSQDGNSYSGSYYNNSYGTGTGTRQVGVVSVDANPKPYVLKVGSSQAFQAVSAGSLDKGFRWTCTAGAIDSNGNFVAPSTPCLATVRATATADTAKSCSIPFQVTNDGYLDISGTFTGGDLGTVTFYQSGTTVYGLNSSIGKLQGTLSNLILNGIDVNGRTFSLSFSQDGNSYSGSYYNNSYGTGTGKRNTGVVTVDINPKINYITSGSAQTFQALVAGPLDKRIVWTCNQGTIDALGKYQAPEQNTLTTLSAAWAPDPTKVGTLTFPVVAPLPSLVINVPAYVTSSWPGATASVPNLPGCTYTWTLSTGTISSGAGSSSIVFTPGAPGTLTTLTCKVTNAIGTASQTGTAKTLAVSAPVQPVISTPTSLSAWMYGVQASVPPQAGMTYHWALVGGIITSSNDLSQITYSVGPAGSAVLSCTVSNIAGTALSQDMTLTIGAGPNVTISSPDSACAGTVALVASVPNQAGATYAWTVTGGTLVAGNGTSIVTFNAGSAGTLTLQCTVTLPEGQSATGQKSIKIFTDSYYAYYSFDEGQGQFLLDHTGHGFTGILKNNPSWVPGKLGQCLAFDGLASHVDIPFLSPFNGSFTVAMWVNLGAVNRSVNNPFLFLGTPNVTDSSVVLYEANGKFSFDFFNDNMPSNTSAVPNLWTHLVFTYNGTTRAIYINGVLDVSQTHAPIQGTGNLLTLGQFPWATQHTLLGTLDELKIYNRALTASEVASLYTSSVNAIIAPRTATLATGQSQAFTATVTGSTNTAVTWLLPDANSGTITPSGVYTAPASIPAQGTQFRVVAQSQADPTQQDTVWVTVNLPVDVVPQAVSLPANGTMAFQALMTPTNGTLTWSVQEPGGGAVTNSGVYTAPAQAGTFHVVATATYAGGVVQTGTATVQVGNSSLVPGLSQGLVGYWNFDSLGNPGADVSGEGNDGILVNGPLPVPGKVGQGMLFNGATNYVALPTVNMFTGTFSISAWVNMSQVNRGDDNVIVGHGSASGNQGLHFVERGGKPYFGFYANDLVGNTLLQPGQWTHLVATYDGTQKALYVNGVLDSTQASSSYQALASNLRIGRMPWGSQSGFLGMIDEVRIYSRALSAADVATLYGATVNVRVSPHAVSLGQGASQTFTAQVADPARGGVAWSLPDGPSSGSLTAAGVYTAPTGVQVPGTVFHVQAQSVSDPTQGDVATVTIQPSVRVVPAGLALTPGSTQVFQAVGPTGATLSATWSVQESGGGTLSATTYTAPSTPGTYHVVATANGSSATATVNVIAPQAGPIAWFPLNEGSGNQVFDQSGFNTATGQLQNSPAWVQGYSGTGLAFQNSTARVTMNPPIPLGSQWTLAAWFQSPLPSTGANHTLTRGNLGDHQVIVSTDQVSLGCYDNTAGTFRDSGFRMNTLAAGWHHLAAVGSGGTTSFYIDGAPVGHVIPWQSTTNVTSLGNYLDNSGPQAFGTVDEFRVYNRALAGSEIAALFAAPGLAVTPACATVTPGGTVAFTALGSGGSTPGVTWSVQEAQGGSIDAFGTYTGPALPGTYHVAASLASAPAVTATAQVVVGPGSLNPDLYFPFDEGSGTTAWDASGRGLPLNLVNGSVWVPGKFGTALEFQDNSNAMGVFNPAVALGANWTVAAWLRTPLPSTGNGHDLFHGSGSDTYITIAGSTDDWLGTYSTSQGKFFDSGFRLNTLPTGWHHVVAVGSGGTTTFYVDGLPAGSPVSFQTQVPLHTIGNHESGGHTASAMDDVRLYQRALGPQDVAALAGQGVEIIPGLAQLNPGGSVQFSAQVPGDASSAVTWSLPSGAPGVVSSTGLYTAPMVVTAGVTTVPVQAQSLAFPSLTGTASVQLGNIAGGMVGYWKFDEGQGTLCLDASGNANSGTVVGSAGWAPGKAGTGLDFNGTGAYVALPTVNSFTGAFSISAWVKFQAVNRQSGEVNGTIDNDILTFGSPTTNHGLHIVERGGKAYFGFYGNDLTGQASLSQGQWTHLTFVYDGQTKYIYINGALDATQASSPFLGTGSNLELGAASWATSPTLNSLDGILDEVRIYSRALSPVDVAALYQSSVNVSLSPINASLGTGQSQTFTARVTGTPNPAVTWSLPDPQSGSLTQSGVYTAPSAVPFAGVTYHVTATSQADATQAAVVPVQVGAPVQVQPQAVTVQALGTQAFTITGPVTPLPTVTWSVQESGGGSVSSTGLFTAPATPGTYHVVATPASGPAAVAAVTVIAGPVVPGGMPDLYLPLDEGVGTLAQDVSGYHQAPSTLVNGPTWVSGKFNSGLCFNQPNARLSLWPPFSLGNEWTLAIWFQYPLSQTNTYRDLVSGLFASQIEIGSDLVSLGGWYGGGFRSTGFQVNTLGAGWHQAVAVGVGGKTTYFVDGSPVGASLPWQDTGDVRTIGNNPDNNWPQPFGKVDDFRIYRRALGSAEIANLFLSTVNVSLLPATPILITGQSQTLTATVTGSSNTAVTWELPVPGSGTITSDGVYTAPSAITADGTVFPVVARSLADPAQTATVSVSVHNPVVVSPAMTTVPLNGTCSFTATTTNLTSTMVTWSCTGGTIDSGGHYTAPAVGGLYTITATSVADSTKAGTAQVYVPLAVTVRPLSVGVLPSMLVGFQVQVVGSSDPSVDWSILEPQGGTINQTGLYQAPAQPGVFHVNATSQIDPKASGQATVTVVQDNSYALDPAYTTLSPGAVMTFHLLGPVVQGTAITWQASGGTISATGTYTAPSQSGTYIITAQFTPDIPRVVTATVVVSGGGAVTVTVSPAQANLSANGTAIFTATVQGTTDTSVTWTCSGGTIDQAGHYTAPATSGTYTVTASSQASGGAYGTAAVTVNPSSGGSATYQYDLNGNLINDGARAFEWDAENRLVSVTINATGHRSEFGYDGMGRRVCIRELDPDQTQVLQVTSDNKYLWDSVEIAEERTADGGTVLSRFYRQGFVDTDGTALYYTRDHLGSIRELTDGTQAIRARYDYDPYGWLTKLQGDRDSAFTFTGYFWHANSGLNLALYRPYDSSLGRWLARDPQTEMGGVNLYAYVMNTPVTLTDPDGRGWIKCVWKCAKAIKNLPTPPIQCPPNPEPNPNSCSAPTPMEPDGDDNPLKERDKCLKKTIPGLLDCIKSCWEALFPSPLDIPKAAKDAAAAAKTAGSM